MLVAATGGEVAGAVAPRNEVAPGRVLAAIGLGSNLDRPERQIERAIEALAGLPATRLRARSALYRTPPWGYPDQPWFVNAAALLETGLDPLALHAALRAIEDRAGRRRDGPRWGPRVLDLDLLLHGESVISSETLTLPHPRMHERAFVLLPLAEIAPDWRLQGGERVADACARLDIAAVTRIDPV